MQKISISCKTYALQEHGIYNSHKPNLYKSGDRKVECDVQCVIVMSQ